MPGRNGPVPEGASSKPSSQDTGGKGKQSLGPTCRADQSRHSAFQWHTGARSNAKERGHAQPSLFSEVCWRAQVFNIRARVKRVNCIWKYPFLFLCAVNNPQGYRHHVQQVSPQTGAGALPEAAHHRRGRTHVPCSKACLPPALQCNPVAQRLSGARTGSGRALCS